MWFATKTGLFRYNGYEMINYKHDPVDPNSIPTDVLETMCIDTAGNVWVGSLGAGLIRFDPVHKKFTQYRHNPNNPQSLSSDWISVLLSDKKGNVWVGTGAGLDRFNANDGTFTHHTSRPGDVTSLSSNEVVGLYEDRSGTIWVGTGSVYGNYKDNAAFGGLNRMDDPNGRFTRFMHDPKDTSTLINNKVRAIYESRDGTFWVCTAGDGLHTMDRITGKFTRHKLNQQAVNNLSRPPLTGDPFSMITFITEDAKGAIWIGTTDNGMTYYDRAKGQTKHIFPSLENAGPENTWTAYSSAEGVLWISTIMGNLYTIDPLKVKVPFVGLNSGEINGFYEDNKNFLWVASGEGGLVQIDQNRGSIVHHLPDANNPRSLRTHQLLTILPDRNGDLWLGTLGHGVEHFSTKTGHVEHFARDPARENSLSNDTVIRIYEDKSGDIWVGTFRGLNLLNKKTRTFTRFLAYPNDTASFGRNLVSSIVEDKSAKCWVGSFVGGGVHILNEKSGFTKTYLRGISVSKVLEDSDGTLWIGAVEGLYYYQASTDSFYRFNDPLGLVPIVDIKTIIEDDNKNLWITSSNSIQKITAERDMVYTYGKQVGVDVELTYGVAYKGRSGKLYFPAVSGYYELFPDKFNQESRPPKIILSNFRLSNETVLPGQNSILTKDISLTDRIVLNYDQNIFSFDFAAVDFIDPTSNKHLFMLDDYDEGWNVAGADRRANYFNVPPGNYVFRVRAVNAYGKWAEKAVSIEIVPAWWSRWWFRIAVIVAAIASIYFLIRWRLQVKYRLQMERTEKETELSRLQHRTAQLEMHALRAQMNPHFLFNSLNSINRFIIQNNSEQASGYLTKFSRLMRLILQNSQYELIPLENELEALKLYLELEAVRFDHHFTYSIKVDDDLDVSALKVPPLIIQPYAENAIWHGLMHKEEKGKLLIELREEGDYLVCSITDDGIGRKKAAELKSKSASTHKSMGMKITADRIASMKQRKSNENNIQITDLVLPDGSPGGTRVEIKIALQYD
jgi:ligand-binding sensor domain-containing protein